jgi:CoA:oxalate CoA-transferase
VTQRPDNPPRILDQIRVLDLTRFLSGPQATLFLAGLGAEVIRIDDPDGGDPAANAPPFFGPEGVSFERKTPHDLGLAYLKRSRAKKAVTLNLKSDEGRALFLQLVQKSDVVVENFRVGVTTRLGLDYEQLSASNPRLIYCAITGYGSTGPEAKLKAFDPMIQAATGLMSITGDPCGDAHKTGSQLADSVAGTFAMAAILGALLQRMRTGRGQFIDVSMADCLVSLMFDEPFDCYEQLGVPLRLGNRIMRFSPFNAYPTRDSMIVVGAATNQDWISLLHVMGRADLLDSPDFMSTSWRLAHNDEVDAVVAGWTQTLSSADALKLLTAKDISCSPIRDARDVAAWPHLRARGTLEHLIHPGLRDLRGPMAPAFPVKFGDASTNYENPAPFVGQHNDEVYGALLGLSSEQRRALKEQGLI